MIKIRVVRTFVVSLGLFGMMFGTISLSSAVANAETKAVVRPFRGSGADKARLGVATALAQGSVTLIRYEDFRQTAERLGIDADVPKGITWVCNDLACNAVLDGEVTKRRGKYSLIVTVRNGSTGEVIGRRGASVRKINSLKEAGLAVGKACVDLVGQGTFGKKTSDYLQPGSQQPVPGKVAPGYNPTYPPPQQQPPGAYPPPNTGGGGGTAYGQPPPYPPTYGQPAPPPGQYVPGYPRYNDSSSSGRKRRRDDDDDDDDRDDDDDDDRDKTRHKKKHKNKRKNRHKNKATSPLLKMVNIQLLGGLLQRNLGVVISAGEPLAGAAEGTDRSVPFGLRSPGFGGDIEFFPFAHTSSSFFSNLGLHVRLFSGLTSETPLSDAPSAAASGGDETGEQAAAATTGPKLKARNLSIVGDLRYRIAFRPNDALTPLLNIYLGGGRHEYNVTFNSSLPAFDYLFVTAGAQLIYPIKLYLMPYIDLSYRYVLLYGNREHKPDDNVSGGAGYSYGNATPGLGLDAGAGIRGYFAGRYNFIIGVNYMRYAAKFSGLKAINENPMIVPGSADSVNPVTSKDTYLRYIFGLGVAF